MIIYPGETDKFTFTFEDTNGDAFDPTSQTLGFYDSEGTLQDSYDETDVTKTATGIYYIDYTVAADAEKGRWTCRWSGTRASFVAQGVQVFQVADPLMPTVEEVRYSLADMPLERVSDNSVELNIRRAHGYVVYNSTSTARSEFLAEAILARAVLETYKDYVSKVERSAGEVPEITVDNLKRYEEDAERTLKMCQAEYGSGDTPQGLITVATIRTTAIDEDVDTTEETSPV